jgi:peptide chain release factor 3
MHPEIARRRTFAIISHPDAGKTTLTEKLLLYGGALELAGSVTARKDQRTTASDWMELERQRGISVASTVLQFEYRDHQLNLLDTPGHKDFSEDTYRVLTAVDAAVMVIDAGKGIESQTRKLFEVCRMRGVPIFTFMNKLDRPARDTLELLDELEEVLGIGSYAVNLPIGSGQTFRGVFDRRARQLHKFERVPGGSYRAPVAVSDLNDSAALADIDPDVLDPTVEQLDLLDGAGEGFDQEAVLAGELTPVFFGSAARNFGVQLLLDAFVDLAPCPGPRRAGERLVSPEEPGFSGFVFKIQANMDPKHRDRMAFVRVCSGVFERDMAVTHTATGERVRLSSSHRVFGQDRETVDRAYPGDVIGLVGRDGFRIGDTLAEDATLSYDVIAAFAPETFVWIWGDNTGEAKRFSKGLQQLLQEGVVQAFEVQGEERRGTLLGAVGPLQLEVVQHRLQSEYGASSRTEPSMWSTLRWVDAPAEVVQSAHIGGSAKLCKDTAGRAAILFRDAWALDYYTSSDGALPLVTVPPDERSGARASGRAGRKRR